MKPEKIEIFDWIGGRRSSCRYDLAKNEMYELNLEEMGVNTSYSDYLHEKDPEGYFKETVARLYSVDPENVIPTLGGSEAIFLASAYIGSISDRILIPKPEYGPIFTVPEALGYRILMDTPKNLLESASGDDSVLLTSPSNPEGLRRDDLVRDLSEKIGDDSRIYVDETFNEFLFKEKPISLYHSNERIIASGTMTKFYGMTRLRTGWLLAGEEDAEMLGRYKSMTSASNPKYPLWLAANILERREKFVQKVRSMMQTNLPVADDFVSNFNYLHWNKPDSAPFGFVKYSMKTDSVTLCRKIYDDTGILLVPGSYLGAEYGFRLCFFLEPEENRKAFSLLRSYFEEEFGPSNAP